MTSEKAKSAIVDRNKSVESIILAKSSVNLISHIRFHFRSHLKF